MAQATTNRRRYPRVKLRVPVRASGQAKDGAWEELGATEDVSLGGLALRLTRPVEAGELIRLTLPMPPQLRLYGDSEPTYTIYGTVRSVLAFNADRSVRIRFFGKNPPRGHALDVGVRYRLPGDRAQPTAAAPERRLNPRYDVFVNLFLGRLPANGGLLERTVTENLSSQGARVPTSLALLPGETVSVREMGGDFQTEAVARGVYVGDDRVSRVNLRFQTAVPRRLINPSSQG